MKKTALIALLTGLFAVGCTDFLEEDLITRESVESSFETEEGFESIVAGAYVSLRAWYGRENGWDFTEAGTDLYTWGADNRSPAFCTYNSALANEEQQRSAAMWAELYTAVNTCNVILALLPESSLNNEALLRQREGEVRFLRAHYLWQITETWGDVVLDTIPTTGASHEANRSSEEDFYQVIFSDLEKALGLLSGSTGEYGRISEPIVEAFLARMYLTRGEYKEAKILADKVIDEYGFNLDPEWNNLWALGNESNNTEVIWPIVYSDNLTTMSPRIMFYDKEGIIQREGGNQGLVMWQFRYEEVPKSGMARNVVDGRGFQRWMPTRFLIELFDASLDQRFKGSFQDTWICNTLETSPLWQSEQRIDGELVAVPPDKVGTYRYNIGDTAMFLANREIPLAEKAQAKSMGPGGSHYYHPESGYLTIDMNDMYRLNSSNQYANRAIFFPMNKKYSDSTNLVIGEVAAGKRDFFAIRIAEMYLISAEAALLDGDPNGAYARLEELADARSFAGDGAALLASYGVTSAADIDIDFILDERARELATEQLRWFDLKRTRKLVQRLNLHNPDAAPNIQEYHNKRFIPQSMLDAVFNKDDFQQNPGYN
jgi:starch-binding outer membrane protein, SusD/RagB family